MTFNIDLPEPQATTGTHVNRIPRRPTFRSRHRGLDSFLRHKVAVAASFVLLAVVLFAYVGPLFWTYDAGEPTRDLSVPPSLEHPFGTDSLGYDLLAEVMRGTQRSLLIALVVGLGATVIGSIWGLISGLAGGKIDALMMRGVDLTLMFPVIVVASFLGFQAGASASGWLWVAVVLMLMSWPPVARIVRGVSLSLKQEEYVATARATGASRLWIVLRHIVPNALGPITVAASILVATSVLAESTLSYLGFGVRPPDTSLGLLINEAQASVNTRPWLFLIPGMFIVTIGICFSFIGDGLRDALSEERSK
ncbi:MULTISPECIES: ABC transporter permease [unclassified Pseudarthrobacter]|uniref:ABC transporter permease n=1 Tax=unclassified Pseudarthrobacter TaxID=2647000 RepID=UPI0030770C71